MKLMMLSIFCLFLTACVSTEQLQQAQQNYEDALNRFVGFNINQFIERWGYPSSSFTIPNGHKVYEYDRLRSYTEPINTQINNIGSTTYATTTGGDTINYSCKTYVETDELGVIVKCSVEGNNCVAVR